jgi:TonB-dependent receptor
MKRTETKIGGKPIRMTALAFAAAQVAMLTSYGAQAQTTDTTAAADSGTTTVVVTGQRRALETAQRIKQEAEQVVDSVVADEAGKLPDKSITEVLQRVVGVTMDRNRSRSNNSPLGGDSLAFSAEGSGVQVRGLSWGSSTLNGRESFSAGWPGRELSWSDVPPELMAAVDVYKNPSSELVEGGISSQINLRTRLPFDQKGAMGALSMSNNYTALGKKNSPAVSGLYSNRWNTRYGEFGALVDLSYNKFKSRYDSVGLSAYYPRTNDVVPGKTVWVPDNAMWGTGEGVSERKGFYGALQWKKDNFETALTYFDSDYNQTDENHSIFATGAYAYDTQYSNARFDNRGVFQSGTLTYPSGQGLNQFAAGGLNMGTTANLSHVGARTRELAWNVKWRASESWVFQNDLQWVHATNHADGALVNLSTFVPSMNMDVTGSMPKITFDPAATKFLADPNNYIWDSVQPALNRAKADLYAWKADARYTFDHPVLRDLRFGVRVTDRSSTKQNATGDTWTSIAEPWGITTTKVPGTLPTPADTKGSRPNFPYLSNYPIPGGAAVFSFPDFFGGKLPVPPQIVTASMPLVQSYWQTQYKQLMDLRIKQCLDAAAYTNDPDRATTKCPTYNDNWRPLAFTDAPKDTSTHSEGTQAIYGTLRFGFDDWRFPVEGNTGVRVVRSKSIAHGYTIFKPGYTASTDPTLPRFGEIDQKLDAGGSHIDYIPSLNLKVNWSDKLQSRLALSKNIYRPGFDQLQEYITLNQQPIWDKSGTNIQFVKYTGTNSGNAQLKPLKSTGLDLTLEWYPRDGQSLTTAFFAKKVKDIIMSETYTRTLKDLAGNDQDFVITGPANAARLWEVGIEIAGMTYLDKLPGLDKVLPDWMKGFGVSSNFTYLKGKQTLYHPFELTYCPSGSLSSSVAGNLYGCDTNGIPFKDLPVPYLSPRAFNFALMYDRGPVSVRLAYSWRDRFLQATNAYGAYSWDGTSSDPARIAANNGVAPKDVGWGLPVWQEATGQWDGGLNYKFNDNLYASFNVSNLTNAVTKQTQQQSFGYSLRSVYAPGRSFRVSMGYAFW